MAASIRSGARPETSSPRRGLCSCMSHVHRDRGASPFETWMPLRWASSSNSRRKHGTSNDISGLCSPRPVGRYNGRFLSLFRRTSRSLAWRARPSCGDGLPMPSAASVCSNASTRTCKRSSSHFFRALSAGTSASGSAAVSVDAMSESAEASIRGTPRRRAVAEESSCDPGSPSRSSQPMRRSQKDGVKVNRGLRASLRCDGSTHRRQLGLRAEREMRWQRAAQKGRT